MTDTDIVETAASEIVRLLTVWADDDGASIGHTARNLSVRRVNAIMGVMPSRWSVSVTAVVARIDEIIANNETNQTEKS